MIVTGATWVLIILMTTYKDGQPVGGPGGATSVPGYASEAACQASARDLRDKDATKRIEMMIASKWPAGTAPAVVAIDTHCIAGPVAR